MKREREEEKKGESSDACVPSFLFISLLFSSLPFGPFALPAFNHLLGEDRKGQESWKVNRVLANQKTEKHREYTVPCNIPFAWFLMKGYNRQDRDFIR